MKFSIAVPIGAYHPFLRHCLRSLAIQTVDLEVALLDASGDKRVKEIATEFEGLLTYARHGPDGGQSDAIIEGWKNTTGDVLGWLNADDMLFPGALSAAAEAFRAESKPDIVYGHSTIVDQDDSFIGFHWGIEPPGDRLREAMTISQPSCFFKRTLHDSIGGLNADLHYTMDWDLFVRMYAAGGKFDFLDRPLSKVLWADDTKTSSFGKDRRTELKRIIQSHTPEGKRRGIMLAFGINHMLENIRPAFLQQAATRALVRGRKVVHGLAADGLIQTKASIPLVHYAESPKAGMMLSFSNPDAASSFEILGSQHEVQKVTGGHLLVPETPIKAGETASVLINAKAPSTCVLTKCAWVDTLE